MTAVRTIVLLAAMLTAACTPAATSGSSATPTATAAPTSGDTSKLDAIRARGTLIVGIRVEQPPANQSQGDPAHRQKRTFEAAVATLVAQNILGPSGKVELRSSGGDRLAPLDQGTVDVVMTVNTPAIEARALLSRGFASSGLVLAERSDGSVRSIEDIRGQTVTVAMDELGARETAERVLRERSITTTLTNAMGVNGAAMAVTAGSSAALIGDRIGVSVLEAARPGTLRVVDDIATYAYVIAVPKLAPELRAAIDVALTALLASGEIRTAALAAGFPYEAP